MITQPELLTVRTFECPTLYSMRRKADRAFEELREEVELQFRTYDHLEYLYDATHEDDVPLERFVIAERRLTEVRFHDGVDELFGAIDLLRHYIRIMRELAKYEFSALQNLRAA